MDFKQTAEYTKRSYFHFSICKHFLKLWDRKHLQSNSSSGGGRTKPRPLRPRNRSMVIDWFIREEKAKGVGLDPCTEKVAKWFHGVYLGNILHFEPFFFLKSCCSGSVLYYWANIIRFCILVFIQTKVFAYYLVKVIKKHSSCIISIYLLPKDLIKILYQWNHTRSQDFKRRNERKAIKYVRL